MIEIGLPVLFAILVWWLGTGVILYLDGLGPKSFGRSMRVATLAALAAFAALFATRDMTEAAAAYVAFSAAVMIWAWNEMAFLMGYLTGPNREPCPPGARGFQRFRLAARTVIDHEIGIAVSAALIMLATFGGANQFGLWTFAVLWAMRVSAKLNIFLGAPNVPVDFLPDHLAYLKSYFRRRAMNGLFPPAITAATLMTAFLLHMAFDPAGEAFGQAGYLLLTTMMALAVLEHWLLFMPLQASALWSWGLKAHERTRERMRERQGLSSWSLTLDEPCSEQRIGQVLSGVAEGRFGEVSTLTGAATSRDGWLTFRVADGRAFIDKAASATAAPAQVTAVGRNLDGKRLSAAFLACAA